MSKLLDALNARARTIEDACDKAILREAAAHLRIAETTGTLRDRFAEKAMAALMPIYWAEVDSYGSAEELLKCQSETAYEYADRMLAQREKLPSTWIKCTDRLPDEGKYVLVRVLTERDYRDLDGSRVRVMKIFKGLTAEERKAEELKTGHSRPYGNSDQHENNLVPYTWQDAGACNSFGQEVTHWQPLPEPPTDD